jgi:hypothetical protein
MVEHFSRSPEYYLPPEISELVEMVHISVTPIQAYLEPVFESDFGNESSMTAAGVMLNRTSTSDDDSDNMPVTQASLQSQTTDENPGADEFSASQAITTRGEIIVPKRSRYCTLRNVLTL